MGQTMIIVEEQKNKRFLSRSCLYAKRNVSVFRKRKKSTLRLYQCYQIDEHNVVD